MLADVLVNELGHLEHADLLLAAEDGFEFVVGVDQRALLRILKPVLLDVVPELLGHLAAGHRLRADHGGEHGVRLDGLHQRRVGLALDLFRGLLRDLFDGLLHGFLGG